MRNTREGACVRPDMQQRPNEGVKTGSNRIDQHRGQLINFLQENIGVFTWSHADMPGYPSNTVLANEDESIWEIYVDGSSNSHKSGERIIILDPGKTKLCYTLQFGFKASNNEAEYEAIIAGLKM